MLKLKVHLIITLILGIISSILLITDILILNNIFDGIKETDVEWIIVKFSSFVFILFYISFFITTTITFRFLKKKISRIYP